MFKKTMGLAGLIIAGIAVVSLVTHEDEKPLPTSDLEIRQTDVEPKDQPE